jgi:integrase
MRMDPEPTQNVNANAVAIKSIANDQGEPYHSSTYRSWDTKSVAPEHVWTAIKNIPQTPYRALAAFLYLTGCRISEVIPYTGTQDWHERFGITKSQIIIDPMNERKVKILMVRNLKRRMNKLKREWYKDERGRERYKLVPTGKRVPRHNLYREIGFSIGTRELPFWDCFWSYADKLLPEQQLFPFTRHQAYRKIAHTTWKTRTGETRISVGGGINPHALRHQRFTHFVNIYRLHPQQLRRKAGWASSLTADHYVDSSTEDIIEQEMQVQNKQD